VTTPCEEIEDIQGDYGTVQGGMGPAVFQASLRTLFTALDKAVVDLEALHTAIPACKDPSAAPVRFHSLKFLDVNLAP
jgi:hypothetical protein